jgi:hypothetical protein
MLKDKSIIAFKFFFGEISITDTRNKHFDSFVILVNKKYGVYSVGDDFICKYFYFQYEYWKDLDISCFKGTVQPSYVIGKKAFKRWLDRDIEFDYKLELYPKQLTSLLQDERKCNLSKFEEQEKQRHYNTIRGFSHCIEKTTLYNRMSKLCFSCKFAKDCKEVQRVNYIKIFKERENG